MRIPDQLLDHLGDLYQKYPFNPPEAETFAQFVERVIYRMEKRCRNQSRVKSKNDNGARMDKGTCPSGRRVSPYDPMRKRVRS